MSGAGFAFLKVVMVFGLIKNGLAMMIGLVLTVALVVSAWAAAEKTMIITSIAVLVGMIVLTMLVIMYYFSFMATLNTIRINAVEGEGYGKASLYVAVISVLIGLFSVIGLLSGIVNVEISGIVGYGAKVLWKILFAVWLVLYRKKMVEAEN